MPHQHAAPAAAGLIYAKTRDGLDLPVIDFSNPRFAVPDDPERYAAQRQAFLDWNRKRRRVPRFLARLLFRRAAKRSRLVRAFYRPDKDFLDSISTYVMKLGVDNLPPGFDGPIDKRVAAAPAVPLIRLRMQQIASLLAATLAPVLSADAAAPLHLINIAGGPALDSLNALIFLNQEPARLGNRRIAIHVLDAEADGPYFGANALAALQQADAPLHGLDITFQHQTYDWNAPEALAALVAGLTERGAIVAASSEGGLFEYGSDAAIVANLQALSGGHGAVRIVAGSVTSGSALQKRMIAETTFKLNPRGIQGFAPLAAMGGYAIARVESNVMSDQVLLRPSDRV